MIDRKDIDKLSALSRLELNDEEKDSLREDIDAILDYVKQVQEVAGHHPGVSKSKDMLSKNVMREDTGPHGSGEYTEDLLGRAPQRKNDHIKVRKILDTL